MFNTFFTPTAESIPVSGSGLGSLNVLDALKKLAFLTQASNLLNQDGDIVLRIGASPTSVILSSPVGRWEVKATDEGELYTRLMDEEESGIVTYWQFTRPDDSIASIEVNSDGELIMVSPPSSEGVDISKIFVASDSGYMFGLGVTDAGEFYTETASTPFPAFKIVNQQDDVLFSTVQQQDSGSLSYMSVYEKNSLPTSPVSINNTLPWVFVKDGETSQPAFYDGTAWRYFSTGGLVIS
jgi:hypothetical protein